MPINNSTIFNGRVQEEVMRQFNTSVEFGVREEPEDLAALRQTELSEQTNDFCDLYDGGQNTVDQTASYAVPEIDLTPAILPDGDTVTGFSTYIRNAVRSKIARTARAGRAGIAALSIVGPTGVVLEASAAAKATPAIQGVVVGHASKCIDNTVGIGYVNKRVLPLATEVVKLYKHAKPAERQRQKTSEMYDNSYHNVTEVGVFIPARLANGRGEGTYIAVADFIGRIMPKDMVAVETMQNQGIVSPRPLMAIPGSSYYFVLNKSTTDGPSSPIALHWQASIGYGARPKVFYMQSRLPNGGVQSGSYSLTAPVLNADLRQAEYVLKHAEQHATIKPLKNLEVEQKVVKVCD